MPHLVEERICGVKRSLVHLSSWCCPWSQRTFPCCLSRERGVVIILLTQGEEAEEVSRADR